MCETGRRGEEEPTQSIDGRAPVVLQVMHRKTGTGAWASCCKYLVESELLITGELGSTLDAVLNGERVAELRADMRLKAR